MTVSGVILGAGLGTRFGGPKQDELIGDSTMLGWVVKAAEASQLTHIVAVVGPENSKPWRRSRTEIVVNEEPERGSMSSLLVGLAACPEGPTMVLLADMPTIGPTVINAIVDAYNEDPRWAAMADYDDGLGHPLILSTELQAALVDLSGDKALWPLLMSAPAGKVLHVSLPWGPPVDVNTRRDLSSAFRSLGLY